MDYRELVNLGLSEKEGKVYIASLECGKAPVQKIAEVAKVNRATTYVIIESLMKKGLMSSINEGRKQFFFAENPEKLTLLFREQAMEIQRRQEYLDKLLPELRSLKSSEEGKPIVKYYEGKKGMLSMTNDLVVKAKADTKEIRTVYSRDLIDELFSREELDGLQKLRKSRDFKLRVIASDSKNDSISVNGGKGLIINDDKYKILSDIAIVGDKVRFAPLKDRLFAIIIDNEEITVTMKTLFDLAWKYIESQDEK